MDFIHEFPNGIHIQEMNNKENTCPQAHQEPIWPKPGRQSMEQVLA